MGRIEKIFNKTWSFSSVFILSLLFNFILNSQGNEIIDANHSYNWFTRNALKPTRDLKKIKHIVKDGRETIFLSEIKKNGKINKLTADVQWNRDATGPRKCRRWQKKKSPEGTRLPQFRGSPLSQRGLSTKTRLKTHWRNERFLQRAPRERERERETTSSTLPKRSQCPSDCWWPSKEYLNGVAIESTRWHWQWFFFIIVAVQHGVTFKMAAAHGDTGFLRRCYSSMFLFPSHLSTLNEIEYFIGGLFSDLFFLLGWRNTNESEPSKSTGRKMTI